VLRRISGPKRDEVTGECRRSDNRELYALYSLPNIIQVIKSGRMRWARHVARIGKKPLGRSKRIWEDNIKMDLKDVGWQGMDWIWLRTGIDGGLM
jgi:hypothetical protein